MLMRWTILLEVFIEILVCYCAIAFGRRIENDDRLHRIYLWRGKEYQI